jgi:hypothetical protein
MYLRLPGSGSYSEGLNASGGSKLYVSRGLGSSRRRSHRGLMRGGGADGSARTRKQATA